MKKIMLVLAAVGSLVCATGALAQNQWVGVAYGAQGGTSTSDLVTLTFKGEINKSVDAATNNSMHQLTDAVLTGKEDTSVTVTSSSGQILAQGAITTAGVQCVMSKNKGVSPLQGVLVVYSANTKSLMINYEAPGCSQ